MKPATVSSAMRAHRGLDAYIKALSNCPAPVKSIDAAWSDGALLVLTRVRGQGQSERLRHVFDAEANAYEAVGVSDAPMVFRLIDTDEGDKIDGDAPREWVRVS